MWIFSAIIIALLLVLINGFFVASEFAIVKLRGTQLDALQNQNTLAARLLKKIHDDLDAYLSACQLGITLASLGLGWIGEPAFAVLFEKLFHNHLVATALGTFLAFILAFFLISYLHIVVGELAPKSLAIRKVERVALLTATPLYIFYWSMYPIIWLLNESANLVLKFIGASQDQTEHAYSLKELKVILSASHMHEDLTKDELKLIDRVLDFTDLEVGDLMRPIREMKAIDLTMSNEDIFETIKKYHFSRYPLFTDKDKTECIGVIHIKDIFNYTLQKNPLPSMTEIKRPVIHFELDSPALDVFQKLRVGIGHFALIRNEYANYVGFLTLDDLLSVALGRIQDEFVKPHRDWSVTKEGDYLLLGHTPLYTLETLLDTLLPEEESNTISGLLLTKLGRMPIKNEIISFDGFQVQVMKVNGPRIEQVKIIVKSTKH